MDPSRRTLSVVKRPFHQPPLSELKDVLQKALQTNFAHVEVEVADCPDLRNKPFTLTQEGLGGAPRIADVGGVSYLTPLVQLDKNYNMDHIAELCELPGAYVIGPGAGPCHHVGVNSEMMANLRTKSKDQPGQLNTYIAKVNTKNTELIVQEKLKDCRDFSLMANLLLCEGKPGKVLKITAKQRTGEENFVTCMRLALKQFYKEKMVGIAGSFVILKGKARLHVMPDFSKVPLNTDEEMDNWLEFYNVPAPLVCLSEFVSTDPGLDLRVEHTHCFSDHGEGGHYHEDTTPQEAEYLGYFTPAEYLYRIDQPPVCTSVGPGTTQ